MDRTIYETNTLPKGYCCKDRTNSFKLSPKGLKLNKQDEQGLAYIDGDSCIVSCGTLRELLLKLRLGQYAIYTIIAIDRVYKELWYVKVGELK